GVDDVARTALRPELGLDRFTVEAWLRRDGAGTTFTSGAGGLRMVPIAAKGLGEGDGSNVDCNYAFGLWGDVLGADFEDLATGGNHPVVGHTAVAPGVWHHVAMTFDGAALRVYLDGELDGETATTAMPRADSIHPFAIGGAVASDGTVHGHLAGALDEVRVWGYARTADELVDGMYQTIAVGDGLIGRWALDDDGGDPATAADSVGDAPLTVTGATRTPDDVALDQGAPPVVAATSPVDGAMHGPDVALDVALELATPAPVDVTYHLRPLDDTDDFTIVVLPDTQIYTLEGRNLEHYFHDQTRWVRQHRAEYNIVGVIHNGDLINNEPKLYQWGVADAAMGRLETPEAELPDGMPYGLAIGNHDNKLLGSNTVPDTTKFNRYFGVDRFAGRAYYGGHHGAKNDDSWVTFSAGGVDFVVVSLMYDLDPDPAVLAWAHSIFAMHPDAFGILNTHYLLGSGGNFGPQARQIYNALRDLPNVHLMTGGHIAAESRRVDTFHGHAIHSMLADYQGRTDGGQGYLRLWEFSPARGTIDVRTYSPTLDRYETDGNSEFSLDVDLRGFGGPYRDLVVADADPTEPGATAVVVEGLVPGTTYEWYADVDSCGLHARTPLQRFTVVDSAATARRINATLSLPARLPRPRPVPDGPVDATGPDDPTLAD
ncbi:MAG: metallophosphoesterase, partial [Myxococcales bacterium]|nr:metallophosphoesterase [Myxococcales bacterium]